MHPLQVRAAVGHGRLSRRRRCVLLPFLDRHAEFRYVVAFPLPPVGFAQAGRHGFASKLNCDDQPRFRLRLASRAVLYANSLVIPKGSHKAVRVQHRTGREAQAEPWLVVTVQLRGKTVSAGLREAYWRQWEGHHVPEFRVTIEEWKENAPPSSRKAAMTNRGANLQRMHTSGTHQKGLVLVIESSTAASVRQRCGHK